MSPSDMTVWDRLALLFPECSADEIEAWYGGDFDYEDYNVTDNTIRLSEYFDWLNADVLRAAIDATKPRPWHLVAQEALADHLDEWDVEHSISLCYKRGFNSINIYDDGFIAITAYVSPPSVVNTHNGIATRLRAAGLTQFKVYKLVEDNE